MLAWPHLETLVWPLDLSCGCQEMNSLGREGRKARVRSSLLLLHWPLTLSSSAYFHLRVISPSKPAFPPTPHPAGPPGCSSAPGLPSLRSLPHPTVDSLS